MTHEPSTTGLLHQFRQFIMETAEAAVAHHYAAPWNPVAAKKHAPVNAPEARKMPPIPSAGRRPIGA